MALSMYVWCVRACFVKMRMSSKEIWQIEVTSYSTAFRLREGISVRYRRTFSVGS